jgi:hypothetical protein
MATTEVSGSPPGAGKTYQWPELSPEMRAEMDTIMQRLKAPPEIVQRVAEVKDAAELSHVLSEIDASPFLQASIGTYGDGFTHDEALADLRYISSRIESGKPYWETLCASTGVTQQWYAPDSHEQRKP